ncbi:MAG: hypothetical protein LBC74_15295, partial [Planctomycetaceae bacterium]|nr:hypothetical protein [Planctomycetaceae bacterium]
MYAQEITIVGNSVISHTIGSAAVDAGVVITSNTYSDANHTTDPYSPQNNYFELSSFTALTSTSGSPITGIFSDSKDLRIDLNGQSVVVTNNQSGLQDPLQYIAAGFGYASNDDFIGKISTDSDLGDFTATSTSGAAYGMIFANTDMSDISSLGAGAFIEVGTLSATTSSTSDVAVGFQAFNVAGGSTVSIKEIKTEHKGTGGSTAGVLLGNVSGTVIGEIIDSTTVKGINITGKITDADTIATGLHATEISQGALVKLGTITINSDGNDEGHLYGVQINQVGVGSTQGSSESLTIGRIAGELEIGDIFLGTTYTANEAIGLLLKNDKDITYSNPSGGMSYSAAPGITSDGKVTLSKITVKTGTGAALGISLGAYNLTDSNVDYGYAAANTLILGGDIDVTSNAGDAIGIFAGQIASLNVSHKISASSNSASSYGIKTVGKTASSDTEKNKN